MKNHTTTDYMSLKICSKHRFRDGQNYHHALSGYRKVNVMFNFNFVAGKAMVITMKKVFAREELCINCRLCEVYCKTNHSKSKDIIKAYKQEKPEPVARIKVYGGKTASVAVNCRHCDDPACVKACITGAMTKDSKTGVVSVNESKCIGCMTCLAVCPIGCIKSGNISFKCDLCGGEETPACVKNCPNRALVFLETEGK